MCIEKNFFGWLELMHKKKKLADSNQVQSLWVMHLDDCIHACCSVTPTEQVHYCAVILAKCKEIDRMLFRPQLCPLWKHLLTVITPSWSFLDNSTELMMAVVHAGFHLGGGAFAPPWNLFAPPLAFSHSLLYSTVKWNRQWHKPFRLQFL